MALRWAGRWLGCMGSMGRSQMYSAFIMLKHFNLRGKKCHFTLYALINRAFPPPAISQFCLQAHPIPTLPMSLQLHKVFFFFFILSHSLPSSVQDFLPKSLEFVSSVVRFDLHYVCPSPVSCPGYPFWKGLPAGHPRKCNAEVWNCKYIDKNTWL